MNSNRDLTWQLSESHYLLKDTWATIRVDTCIKPDSHVVTPYYVYEFPDWVTALALTQDGKVILEKQYRHALGVTMFEIPGGCVDKSDPSLEYAIARELREETGYVFDQFHYLGKTSANPSTNTNLMHMFVAYNGVQSAEQELDAGEDLEVLLVTMDELLAMFKRGDFVQSMHVTAICYGLMHLGKLQLG